MTTNIQDKYGDLRAFAESGDCDVPSWVGFLILDALEELGKSQKSQNSANKESVALITLMNRHGTDKLYTHHYDEEYARHFAPLREQTLNILEIGVGGYGSPKRGGESLKVWRDYFPYATIHGLDSEPKKLDLGDRVNIWRGSQSDTERLIMLIDDIGAPDIIIDDGSHRQDDIFASFTTLFPLMNSGGIYVIEDLETAYRTEYGGDPVLPPTIRLLQTLIDGLHWPFWRGRGPKPIDQLVKSVQVSKELAFIYRH